MKEKILAFLKTRLQGVSESYLNGVADLYGKTLTEEAQIETTFTDGVIDLIKLSAGQLQTEGDKRATEAAKTALKNYQEKHGLDENGKPKGQPKTDDPPKPDDLKTLIQEAINAAINPLQDKLNGFEKEKTTQQLTGKLMSKLKEKGIPESYLKGRNLLINEEAEVDQLTATIESDYTAFKQEMAEQGVIISVPKSSVGEIKAGEAFGASIAERRNTGAPVEGSVKGKEIK